MDGGHLLLQNRLLVLVFSIHDSDLSLVFRVARATHAGSLADVTVSLRGRQRHPALRLPSLQGAVVSLSRLQSL